MMDTGRLETVAPFLLVGLLAMWAAYDARKWGLGILAGFLMILLMMW